jgi:hypothetical protein
MTLPSTGYHARAVTFGCMTKGKGVSSRANLLITVKVLAGNAVTTSHHARAVSPDYLLNKKERKYNKNEITKGIKGMNGLGKNCIHDRYNSPSTKAPTDNILHPWPSLHPLAWTSLDHFIHLHGLEEVSSRNFPHSVDTSPIGCLALFPDLYSRFV